MNIKIFSNAVIAFGAIALVVIPASNLMAQTLPTSRQIVKPRIVNQLPVPAKQAPSVTKSTPQPVTTYRVPVTQRQIFSPQARRNIVIAPGAVPVRQPAAPVANTGRFTPPTIRNPYPTPARAVPAAGTPAPSNGQAASLTSSKGAIGNRIGIAVRPSLSQPVFLIFSTGGIVPANITSRVLRDGRGFYTPVPVQLCFNNVQNWVAKLQLADGTLLNPVGYFARPTNCP